ncbi:GNAT family N-acetyltransferase [Vreelandella nigrificans]|nr:GNAT family N-acetyltransferase [Halomonas nigrificans]
MHLGHAGSVPSDSVNEGVMKVMDVVDIEQLVIRRATVLDAPAVLKVFDEVMAWFVQMGNEGQWGCEPWSASPRRIQLLEDTCALPGAWVAEDKRGHLFGALVLGEAQPYVSPATEPEIYVRVLVASRDVRARGIGRRLLAFADNRARAAGVQSLRVDCYGGGTGALVRFYESCGYERIAAFSVDGWPCQLLGRSLKATDAS